MEPFFHQPNDFLIGLWAAIATVFVFREAKNPSLRAGVDSFFATFVSCVLTFAYLLLFPFSPVGMALIIGLGTIILMLPGRRQICCKQAPRLCVFLVQVQRSSRLFPISPALEG